MTTAAAQLAQPFGSVPALVRAHSRDQPDKLAVVCQGRALTYAELDRLIDRAAAALQRDGARPGGAVAICAAASERYVVLYLAAVRAGCAAVPLAPSGTSEQLAAMVADSGAGLLAVDAAADVGTVAAPRMALDDGGHATGWSDWLADEGAVPTPVEPDPDAAFNIIYSSGTTGVPKGIVQSQRMRWRQQQIAERVGFADAVTLIATPLYSNTTLVALLPTLSWGGTVALLPRFDAAAYLDLAEGRRATHTMLVPVQYRRLMDEPTFDARDLSAFRYKTSTSAPFAAALKRQVLDRWPGKLIEYYGMTEGGGSTILIADEFPDKLATVGRPAPGHDIRLIDADGREVPVGEAGEVVGRSGVMMSGYHGRPDKTAETLWHDVERNALHPPRRCRALRRGRLPAADGPGEGRHHLGRLQPLSRRHGGGADDGRGRRGGVRDRRAVGSLGRDAGRFRGPERRRGGSGAGARQCAPGQDPAAERGDRGGRSATFGDRQGAQARASHNVGKRCNHKG